MPYQPIVERCINDAWNGVSVSKYYAGVHGLDDVDALGIKGPYRRDFERLYLGKPVGD